MPKFTHTKYVYFEKDSTTTKLFTWLMKMNFPLIFQFTCTHAELTANRQEAVCANFQKNPN